MHRSVSNLELDTLKSFFRDAGSFDVFTKSEFDALYLPKHKKGEFPQFSAKVLYEAITPITLAREMRRMFNDCFFFRAPFISKNYFLLAHTKTLEVVIQLSCFENYEGALDLYGLDGETCIKLEKMEQKELSWNEEDEFLFTWSVTFRGKRATQFILNKDCRG